MRDPHTEAQQPAGGALYVAGAAMIVGFDAMYLSRLLSENLAQFPPTPRTAGLRRTADVLRRAGDTWATSVDGSSEVDTAEAMASSGHGHHDLIDSAAAADLLGVCARRVLQLRKDGLLSADKLAGRWMFDRPEVLALAEDREVAA